MKCRRETRERVSDFIHLGQISFISSEQTAFLFSLLLAFVFFGCPVRKKTLGGKNVARKLEKKSRRLSTTSRPHFTILPLVII